MKRFGPRCRCFRSLSRHHPVNLRTISCTTSVSQYAEMTLIPMAIAVGQWLLMARLTLRWRFSVVQSWLLKISFRACCLSDLLALSFPIEAKAQRKCMEKRASVSVTSWACLTSKTFWCECRRVKSSCDTCSFIQCVVYASRIRIQRSKEHGDLRDLQQGRLPAPSRRMSTCGCPKVSVAGREIGKGSMATACRNTMLAKKSSLFHFPHQSVSVAVPDGGRLATIGRRHIHLCVTADWCITSRIWRGNGKPTN